MFNKTIYIVLISVFILIFSLTCVSAAQDNITTDELAVGENINIESSVEDEGILADSNNGTFTDLSNLIKNDSVGAEIKLEKDYYYDKNTDSDFEYGIYLYDSLTIDGQGHKIDAKNNTIFRVPDYELKVILKNITFLNGKNVVRFYEGDLTIVNSNFINCSNYGYAIKVGGSGDLNIINSSFINNDNGGINFGGSDLNIINSSFINNSAYEGGAIYLMSVYERAYDYYSPSKYNIINSIFMNNTANRGGAIYLQPDYKQGDGENYYYFPSKCNIINSSFINNHAKIYYSAYFGKTFKFNNCTFKDNYVKSKLKIGVLNYPSRKTTSIVNAEYGEDCFVLLGLSDNNKQFSFKVNHKRIVNDFEFKHKIVISGAKKFKLTSRNVNFKINGKTEEYTRLKINGLTPKTYLATITYHDIYNNIVATKTFKIVVKKATPKITAKKLTFKPKKKSKKYTITLKSGENPVKKVKVHLKIGKKTFKATTNSKGKAVFKIKLNTKGTYNSKITFKGNKCYKASSKTVKIKIK